MTGQSPARGVDGTQWGTGDICGMSNWKEAHVIYQEWSDQEKSFFKEGRKSSVKTRLCLSCPTNAKQREELRDEGRSVGMCVRVNICECACCQSVVCVHMSVHM